MEVAIMYCIAALSITFGFIALLKQKTYISETTMQPTDIEIKGLGKMKTNYPSLVFVFLGFLCAVFAYYRSSQLRDYQHKIENYDERITGYETQIKQYKTEYPGTEKWTIRGSLVNPGYGPVEWRKGIITVTPVDYSADINDYGVFKIDLPIKKNFSFEDIIQSIDYSNDNVSVSFCPQTELGKYNDGDSTTRLSRLTKTTRLYKPLAVTNFPK
jgi:hypothetical protein